MHIKIRLFGMLRELAGQSVLELEVPSRTTAGQVWRYLVDHYPRLGATNPGMAVNLEYTSPDAVLGEGDEVAFLPPVAGGRWPSPISKSNTRRGSG